ncbi:hypothetical protein F0P96_15330 [Hymenobacter busanensis]|uniref:Uncharacterized protein n=1 Tax=Hymenobacter busanensis TaxID=2607656 RepID=A0A7L5A188_9BACT|nr:hypothetical protein [Hymenobacter busanensis]KAA9331603.1 hypothetical protein F0P96_15330 [Hymenobacter busanensis]QHJ08755.1 hypothetical protein GUY19_16265 [Hymenobacter busanensis]
MKQFFSWGLGLLLVLGSVVGAQAQTQPPAAPAATPRPALNAKFSSDPEKFIGEVVLLMASTKNAAAIATTEQLRQMWASNKLTTSQQAKVIALAQQMQARKLKPRPVMEAFFGMLVAAKQGPNALNDQQTDEMLTVTGKALAPDNLKGLQTFISTTTQFLKTRLVHSSRYSRMRMVGGTVSFAYNDNDYPTPAGGSAGGSWDAPKPEPVKVEAPKPAAPKPAAKAPAKKAAPKPVAKKKSSGWDDWDSGDWGSSGWDSGKDDGWGAPVKKKATPAKKPAATASKATKPAEKTQAQKDAEKLFESKPVITEPAVPAYMDTYSPPPTQGPVLVLKDVDLVLATGYDSVVIKKTSGSMLPGTNRFVGTGGEFSWTLNNNPLTAKLTNYDFDVTKPEFKAEPVTLEYPAVLEAPIRGALAYKSVQKKNGTDTGYPRFVSLTNDARVKNIGDNITYNGGFSLNGARMYSSALDGSLSRITVALDGKPRFKAASRSYQLGDTLISSNRASITIFQGVADSVTHPGVKLKFSKLRKVLMLAREEGLYKTTPYYDSFHQMELSAELLTWNVATPNIDFRTLTAKNQVAANFESKEFYTNTRYQQIKAINRMHPLQMIVGYYTSHDNPKTFAVQDVVEATQLSEPNVRSAISGLARDGYVGINPINGEVSLLPKALHYVNSSRGKKDYDHIAIKSLSPAGHNATLNLNNNVLLVRGVDKFAFSDDSVTVYVKPDSSLVRIQKNRNIDFSGTVVASAFIFKGKEFKFDYNGFFIDMFKIDSIIVKGKGSKGSVMRTRKESDFALTNKGRHSAGRLYINAPNNKSGRKKLGAYPSFDATTGAYVFFNKPEVLGGAYDTTIYFDIPPFKLDSLNNANRAAVGFKGTFVTSGIMPDFKTKLTLQEDGSLGFVYAVPKEGFPLYGGKARLYNQVRMSNRGIQGDGQIDYLAGNLKSDQFIFYKDSVVTVGKSATIKEGPLNGAEYPKVALLPGYQMKWVVKADSMYLSTPPGGEAMRFYDATYLYKGTAALTPKGLFGTGRMESTQSVIRSPSFTFLPTEYKGGKATVSIKSAEPNKPALTANDVAFNYNIKRSYADFTREEGMNKSAIDLPYSQYRTSLSGGRWDFKKKTVQLRVAPGQDSTRAYFYSVKPEQKGLRFRAASGMYDLNKYRLIADGVPHIAAADAWIEPDSNRVYVLPNAEMKAFQNAGITMDTLTKYHKLYKGEIKVLSRAAFMGNALYSYKTPTDSFAVKFSNFTVDSTAIAGLTKSGKKKGGLLSKGNDDDLPPSPPTLAKADIKATEKFRLAPRIQYRGGMTMNSQRKGFAFDGQARLEFSKVPTAADWFPVQDSIDPQLVKISLKEPKAEDGTALVTGLYQNDGTGKPYPLFVATKPNVTDGNLFEVDGTLVYDPKKRTYTISRHDALDPEIYEGNVLTVNDSTAQLDFRGKLNLINSTKDYTLITSAIGKAKPDSNRYQLDAMMAFDINFPDKAIEAMAEDMAKYSKGLPEALIGQPNEYYKMGEFAGSKAVNDYANRKGGYMALQKVSGKFLHDIMLSQVPLKWDDKRKAWFSTGKIGLVSIGKKDINALIDGYIEIKKESTGDVVELYLEADPETWYYFKYAENKLLAKAQHGEFDEILGRAAKGDYNVATDYGFFLGDESEKVMFVNHFRKDYLGQAKPAKQIVGRPKEPEVNVDGMAGAGKKKKKDKADDEFGGDTNAGGTDPAAEPAKKEKTKKKKADPNDPFATDDTGAGTDPAAEPVKEKKKKKEEAAPAPDAGATEPAAEPAKKEKKKKEEAPATPPADDAAQPAEPAAEPAKKEKKKKEEAAPAEDTAKPAEPAKETKKEKEKKKKKEDDPFGDE